MKDFFVRWTARGRIVTFVVVVCALAGGSGSAWASGKTALVAVGFTGAPPQGFQNVLLNVQAVRVNPHVNAGPSSSGWQSIPTPPGIGGGSQSAELQIDLNTSQNVPEFFNMSKVRPGTYRVAQILLDSNNPGSLIPNCPQSPGGPEGCISYPMALTNGQVITTPISMLAPSNGIIAPLLLQAQVVLNGPAPIKAGDPYPVTLILNPSTAGLGTVTGSITHTGTSSGSMGKLIKLGVTAETIGTNTAIASALVKNNTYTLMLPAAGGVGTLYDLAVAGGGDSYAATRLPPLIPGVTITGPTFAVTGQIVGNITGSVMSACVAGTPIVGATLQVLVPPVSNPGVNCSTDAATAAQCVTVASATTDNAGDFPLPGSLTTPPQFENVPAPPSKNLNGAYAMEVTAPGYDPLFVQVKPSTGTGKNNGGVCAPVGSTTFSKCDLALTTAFISGTIPITPPLPGQTTLVQVFAEPTGTNNIQSSLAMPISNRNPNGLVKFTINVPSLIPTFDLFATTIDQYQGSSSLYPGHTIAVLSPLEMPMPLQACNTNSSADFVDKIECVGHGSIVGTAGNANLGASIALSKPDPSDGNQVQITTAQIQNQPGANPSPSNTYAFCVPADTYQVQPIQLPPPVAGEAPLIAPTAYPTGEPATVTIIPAPLIHGTPGPTPTSSGGPTATPTPPPFKTSCPTTCSNPDGSCPGICNTTVQGLTVPPTPLPPPPPTTTPTATATP